MQTTDITALNHTVEQTNQWLDELVEKGPFANQQQAYSAFRAVLHAIRDNLVAGEAAHLASQLPMLVRGFYWEGWRPAEAPNTDRTRNAFLAHVESSLDGDPNATMDLEEATRAVTALLEEKLTEGQARHVRGHLSEEVRELWAHPAGAS